MGYSNNVIEDSYATGNVHGEIRTGGLVGQNSGGVVSHCYAKGEVEGTHIRTGGLVGLNGWNGRIENSYATGGVSGNEDVGGLVGSNIFDGVVNTSYSSGKVEGNNLYGGLIGRNTATVENSFWDNQTSGQQSSAGEPGAQGRNTTEMMTESTFAGWDFTDMWWMVDGNTRPFLRMEWDTTVKNSHQLQLMAMDKSADYVLGNNIDMSDIMDPASMWGTSLTDGAGFVPVGDISGGFLGSMDGRNQAISGLYINRPEIDIIGLFGQINGGASISNTILMDAVIYGRQGTGGFVGNNLGTVHNCHFIGTVYAPTTVYIGGIVGRHIAGTVSHCTSSGYIRGTRVGGIAGENYAIIRECHSSMTVQGSGLIGGLVGYNRGDIVGSSSGGHVDGFIVIGNAGGLVGYNHGGTITDSRATGAVNGGYNIGGLIGYNLEGNVVRSYATGNVSGRERVGGFVGYNNGFVSHSYSTGAVTGDTYIGGFVGENYETNGVVSNSYTTGNVFGNESVGGFTGYDIYGTVSNSYSTGTVSANNNVGGFVGLNYMSTLSNSYAKGDVIRLSGSTSSNIGGFVGWNDKGRMINCYSTGSVHYEDANDPTDKGFAGIVYTGGNYEMTGNFWDMETSGQTSSAGNATGENTEEMKTRSTFTNVGWDFVDVWWMVEQKTYPLLSWSRVYNVHTDKSFETIQSAINALDTLDGHTICVAPGIFRENIMVHKSLEIIGSGMEQTYVDASGGDIGILIMANHTRLRDLTVMNATNDNPGAGVIIADIIGEIGEDGPPDSHPMAACIVDYVASKNNTYGIILLNVHDSTLENGYFDYNLENGIFILGSDNNDITGNSASHNGDAGLVVLGSDNNRIHGNEMSQNLNISGIILSESHGNDVYDNTLNTNGLWGIGVVDSQYNRIYDNTVSNHTNMVGEFPGSGILLSYSNHTEIRENTVMSNMIGIFLFEASHFNDILDNTVTSNTVSGIEIVDSTENTITGNIISDNGGGILLENSHDNRIYHNIFMNNDDHAWDDGINLWDDGYPSGGNYWDDHTEPDEMSGPGQSIPGSDGIVDVRRGIDGNGNADNYPWTNPNFELMIIISAPIPADNAENIALDATLSVLVETDNHPTVVEFYLDGLMIHSETVNTDGRVTATPDLEFDARYIWYVTASNDGGANQVITPDYTFTTESQTAHAFSVSVDDITAGEPPVIVIFDGEDVYGNPLEGEFTVVMVINDDEETVDLLFHTGEAEYTWPDDLTATGDYTAMVRIDDITLSEGFSVGPATVFEVVLEPSEDQNITSGQTVQFSAAAYDIYGNLITDAESDFTWANTAAVNSGLFDETVGGTYNVTASYGGVTSNVVTVTVEEEMPVTYVLTLTIDGEGTVAREPQQDEYEEGTTVTLTATAADGWEFVRWTGDATGTGRNTTVTMDGNKTVTAVFREIDEEIVTYVLTVNIVGQGTVTINPQLEEYEEGTTVTLTATAAAGWEFVEWTGDGTGTSTVITFNMDENKSVTAVFREIEEDEPGEFMFDYLWLILLIIIVVIILMLILLKKKGGSQVPKDELAEDELAEDELAEDELAEDELAEDELAEDELAEDELAEDKLAEDELAEDELVEDELAEDDH